jgi:carboxyl-terminal processing protease
MGQSKGYKIKIALGLSSLLMAAMPVGAMAQEASSQSQQAKEIMDLISTLHVSGVTATELQGKSVEEMLHSLNDPYTTYFSEKDLLRFESSIENNYVGIGARVGQDADGVYISEIFAGSPAEKAGLQPEDYIQAVNGLSVNVKPLDVVIGNIVGEPGTRVTITVLRAGHTLDLEVTRAAVNIPEVYSKRFDHGTGYIQITDFSSDADEEFSAALKKLQDQGLNSLVVDLRNNPGGLLETAQHIAKHFIKDGVLIHTRDRNGKDDPVSINGGSTLPIPVYILLNEYSASASEVLSGALQDYKAAKVIGMKSYGKGSVQRLYGLGSGGVLKLTVEEYLTPNRHSVNKIGIHPDLEVDGEAAQMISALHAAGIDDVTVEIGKHSVSINKVRVNDSFRLIRKNDHLYAPTRALASLVKADIAWNGGEQTVDVSLGGIRHAFPIAPESLIIENGTSYVNVDAFTQFFPKLRVVDDGKQVTFSAVKEN